MKLVIAGSHDAQPPVYALHLLQQLAKLPIDGVILLRGPLEGHPGPIELMAEQLAQSLQIEVEWRLPVPHTGREGTITRDMDMVAAADEVLAYFHPNRIMDGGTGRVVELAQQRGKRVEAFAPLEEDVLMWIGSEEPVLASVGYEHRPATRGDS